MQSTDPRESEDVLKRPGRPELQVSGDLLGSSTNGLNEEIGSFLKQGSLVGFVLWLGLLWVTFRYAPDESFERLEGPEMHANVTVLFLLLYTNLSRICRMVIRDRGFLFANSGVMVGSITVQTIAIVSVSLMVFFPTPVVTDPVTGIRSHLVRWCEWTAAAFLMTFLTESVDIPVRSKEQQQRESLLTESSNNFPLLPWLHGIAISLSTSAGAISAFSTTRTQWWTAIGISWVLFCSLFVRLYQRYQRLINMSPGTLVEEKEDYDRAKYSFKTIAICTAVWTTLAGSWIVISLLTPATTTDSLFSNPALMLITESFFEAVSKIWYADLLIEIHNIAFDDATRTMRRLEELRSLMAAVWDHCSDALIWGSRAVPNCNVINGIVSPKGVEFLTTHRGSKNLSTMLLEIDRDSHKYRSFFVDLSAPISRESAIALRSTACCRSSKEVDFLTLDQDHNLSVVADLLCEAQGLSEKEEKLIMKKLVSKEDSATFHQCEAKMTKLGMDSSLIVIRDISERYQCFETEKKLIAERTARKKDFEANRFTRHEVKNGLLAAIGLVETIREHSTNDLSFRTDPSSISTTTQPLTTTDRGESVFLEEDEIESPDEMLGGGAIDTTVYSGVELSSEMGDSYGELDNTLRDVLDTIMDHAMSLDVINEEYDVRLERVCVPEVLSNIRRQANCGPRQSRFPLECSPSPFPILGLDPRLLRHIYQNALSNASRYGKVNGDISTKIAYDETKGEFRMEVTNEPGPGHTELLQMTKQEVSDKVFSQGSRLATEGSEITVSNSSGDGAWIMKKCSKILKGDVYLKFEHDRTVLTFWCPAGVVGSVKRNGAQSRESMEFTILPSNTWGVVVDDSGIQRKLMDRLLKIAGVDDNRRIILGQSPDEIYNFCDQVVEILAANPKDKVILIADENLDVVDGVAHHSTVSGSLCIEKLLEKLDTSLERRLLALVRSANDSSKEIRTYTARAHGFLPKAPIDKDGVLCGIQPWWIKRFGSPLRDDSDSDKKNQNKSTRNSDTETYDLFGDIVQAIEVISALCKVGSLRSLRNRWKSIREKLHALKGDLKSAIVSKGDELRSVLSEIDSLWHEDLPDDFPQRWASLETKLYAMVEASKG